MNTYNEILPDYSLADLFKDIRNGNATEFIYNGMTFYVKINGLKWTITEPISQLTASTVYYVGSMTDLHGMASCITHYNRHITFDREGNINN